MHILSDSDPAIRRDAFNKAENSLAKILAKLDELTEDMAAFKAERIRQVESAERIEKWRSTQ